MKFMMKFILLIMLMVPIALKAAVDQDSGGSGTTQCSGGYVMITCAEYSELLGIDYDPFSDTPGPLMEKCNAGMALITCQEYEELTKPSENPSNNDICDADNPAKCIPSAALTQAEINQISTAVLGFFILIWLGRSITREIEYYK